MSLKRTNPPLDAIATATADFAQAVADGVDEAGRALRAVLEDHARAREEITALKQRVEALEATKRRRQGING